MGRPDVVWEVGREIRPLRREREAGKANEANAPFIDLTSTRHRHHGREAGQFTNHREAA